MFRPLLLVLAIFAIVVLVGTIAVIGFGPDSRDEQPLVSPVARPLALELPLDCAIPERCVVQFQVDRRQGPAVGDYRCNRLSYDTHRGTDFRVLSPEDLAAGIPVLAAASGKVVGVRDGMEDVDVTVLGRNKIEGRAAGNQVVLAHENGWETYYWHLRKGSVAVQQGQQVAAGARLGLVGLSGDTNFPHLHFELRRNGNRIVDPFNAAEGDDDCRTAAQSLWTKSAAARLAYAPIVTRLGFASRELTRLEAFYGRANEDMPTRTSPALFLWMEIYGLARDDVVSLQWELPDGTWRAPSGFKWDGDLPYAFRTGKLNLPPPLIAGTYSVRLKITRGENAPALYEKIHSIAVE